MNKNEKIVEAILSKTEKAFDFEKYKKDELVHRLHPYPAVMIYPIGRLLLESVKKEKEIKSVFDPFSGSGTNIVESIYHGCEKATGNDLNPLSEIITRARVQPLSDEIKRKTLNLNNHLENLLLEKYWEIDNDISRLGISDFDVVKKGGWISEGDEIDRFLKDKYEQAYIRNIGYWFKPDILMKLLYIKKIAKKIDFFTEPIFLATFSETIRKHSNQRNSEHKLYRMESEKVLKKKGDVFEKFTLLLKENVKRVENFQSKLEKPYKFDFFSDDTRNLGLEDGSFDLVLTSPPYGDSKTTVAYGQFSRLSLELTEIENPNVDSLLLGGGKRPEKKQEKSRGFSKSLERTLSVLEKKDKKRALEVENFFDDFLTSFKEISRVTKKRGLHFWVVSNRMVRHTSIPMDKIMIEFSFYSDLSFKGMKKRKITSKRMPVSTHEAKNTMIKESILIFEKI